MLNPVTAHATAHLLRQAAIALATQRFTAHVTHPATALATRQAIAHAISLAIHRATTHATQTYKAAVAHAASGAKRVLVYSTDSLRNITNVRLFLRLSWLSQSAIANPA